MNSSSHQRYPSNYLSGFSTKIIHRRNPWAAAWWSAALPGFGFLHVGSLLRGYLLVVWEVITNNSSHLNTAILYSFNGDFRAALTALDTKWLLMYPPVYIFCIWSSYRLAVEFNKQAALAAYNRIPSRIYSLDALDINALDLRTPWLAAAWSLLMPGVGHLYVYRTATAFFLLAWWMTVAYFSNALTAVQLSFIGDFSQAKAVVNYGWLMFMPSVYGFAVHDAYVSAVEGNKLFRSEQTAHLTANYQSPAFIMPV
ncbi:MAG: hypothetical protein N2491_08610 [Negativicutes bacterium]|nr:hypothetical protein [Negativicutes bacterium]